MEKSYWKTFLAVFAVIGLLFAGAYYFENNYGIGKFFSYSGSNEGSQSTKPNNLPNQVNNPNFKQEDLTVGTGAEAKAGDEVSVNYVGTLTDGTKFDSSYDRGQAFSFKLGTGQVIKGWDLGVLGMKVGGKRKLTIPPDLGYGSQAMGSIPANSTLVFEVELLGVKSGK